MICSIMHLLLFYQYVNELFVSSSPSLLFGTARSFGLKNIQQRDNLVHSLQSIVNCFYV
jgi:hypothetical protein